MLARLARSLLRAFAAVAAVSALCDCSTIRHVFHSGDNTSKQAEQLKILQIRTQRFADEYVGSIVAPIRRFQESTDNAVDRLDAQNWMLSQATAAYTIASGPSPYVNAVDLVVLATLSRMVIDDAWVGERFGERAGALRDAYHRLEPDALELAKSAIPADQIAALQQAIDSGAFDSAQVVYNMLNPSAAAELPPNYPAQDYGRLFDHTRAAGVGVVGIRVLAGGALSGSTERHPIASPPPEPIGSAMSYDADLARSCRLLPLVKEGFARSLTEAATRFAISHPAMGTILVGMATPQQFEDALAAVQKGRLPPAALGRSAATRIRWRAAVTMGVRLGKRPWGRIHSWPSARPF